MIIFDNFTKTDTYIEVSNDDEKMVLPISSVILVEDESGYVSIKTTGSRKTIGLITQEAYGKDPNEPEHYKLFGYLSNGDFYVIPENGNSTLTSNETDPYKNNIVSAKIGTGVTSIGWNAFYNCSSLTSVTIPDSVTSIDSSTFYNCSSLTGVTIPDSVTSIGWNAFKNCSNLAIIKLSQNVTSLDRSFIDNSPVQALYVNCDQFNTFKNEAMLSCPLTLHQGLDCNLEKKYSITLTNGETYDKFIPLTYNIVRFNCIDSSIVSSMDIYQDIDLNLGYRMSLPSEINVYSENAKVVQGNYFIKPSGLKEGIRNLYWSYDYGIFNEDIVIPSTVEELYLKFKMQHPCDASPKRIVMKGAIPPVLSGVDITYSTSGSVCPATIKNVEFYVPDASVDTYKAASGWSEYADKIKPISEFVE